ncbi:hypothetical protein [Azorhizobium doebereinerae]|uniref:bestrophin-like domain n=1 Tax=Azorhizobium doebereinerae TaxID=281091 RepID=UPI00041514F9|nr:hypothetical protein [Azorhizobium doebereinerae]
MNSWAVAAIAFVCMFSAAMGAMLAARYLPAQHVSKETQDAVKLGVGMIAAMASLILGLMTASVKGAFDTTDRDVHTYATYIRALDSTLRHYGPEAIPARALLDGYSRAVRAETWDEAGLPQPSEDASSEVLMARLDSVLHGLAPATDEQRQMRSEALPASTRWSPPAGRCWRRA